MTTMATLRPALVLLGLFTALTGAAYPAAVTGIAQTVFPKEANGSLVMRGNSIVGSELVGQPFADPRYFWGRPSATAPFAYNAGASAGSNLGPTNPALHAAVKDRIQALKAAHGPGRVPIELVTTSGSGLDPHISPAAALYQAARVAQARGLPDTDVRRFVEAHTEGRSLGWLGEPRVNVALLNLALDRAETPRAEPQPAAR